MLAATTQEPNAFVNVRIMARGAGRGATKPVCTGNFLKSRSVRVIRSSVRLHSRFVVFEHIATDGPMVSFL